jgi:hypothetical protein
MGELDYLVFLTLTTINREPRMTWQEIMLRWSRLVAWLRRVYGPLEYVVVKEEGANGLRHLHAIVSGWRWVPVATLSAKWKLLTGAYRVWVERVVGRDGVAGYLGKYLAKGNLPLRKLLTYSAGWPKLPVTEFLEVARETWFPARLVWAARMTNGSLVEWWGNDGPCSCFGTEQLLE